MTGRPRIHLIVAAPYHDGDYVRRQLLDLIGEDDLVTTSCTNSFHDVAGMTEADMLVTYTGNVFPDDAERRALDRYLRQGGRWLCLHVSAAYTCFKPPAVNLGGIELPGLTDTPDVQPAYMDIIGARFVSHLPYQPFEIHTVSDHPLVRGLPPFTVADEPYIMEIRGDCETLLESRYTGEATGYANGPWLEDLPRPQMLLHRHGEGEVLFLAPGHACGRFDLRPFIDELPQLTGPWTEPTYREIIRRALRWGTRRPI